MHAKKAYILLCLFFIIFGLVIGVISLLMSYSIYLEREQFFEEEGIYFERFSVREDDGIEIQGFHYVPTDLREKTDGSVPAILLIHGIHGRKEFNFEKVFQLVKRGYAVFSVEQRGHGESGGLSAFLAQEPHDMSVVIDYIDKHYEYANASYMGVLGLSYGGGIASILQATDERVYASVLYHPLTSIEYINERIPFEKFIGITPMISNLHDIEDASKVCSADNMKNVLIIHGTGDRLIEVEQSEKFYEQIDGDSRNDIQIEFRPDLDHDQTESDEMSLKYTVLWFEHFFHDPSINLTQRDSEIKNVSLYENGIPYSSLPQINIIIAAFSIFIGVSLLVLALKVWPIARVSSLDFKRDPKNFKKNHPHYKRMVTRRIFLYFIPVITGSILFSLFNPSYLYGYFLAIPLATILLMIIVPRSEYLNRKSEWFHWYWFDSKVLLWSIPIIVAPIAFFVVFFNACSFFLNLPLLPFLTTSALMYFLMLTCPFYADYMFLRGFKYEHTVIIIFLKPLTLFIFFLFVPVPLFPLFPYFGRAILPIAAIALIGLLSWTVLNVIEAIWYIYRNKAISMTIIFLPITIILLLTIFRII